MICLKRKSKIFAVLLLTAMLLTLWPGAALVADPGTVSVGNEADLRETVTDAVYAGYTVRIVQDITLTSPLTIGQDVTLTSENGSILNAGSYKITIPAGKEAAFNGDLEVQGSGDYLVEAAGTFTLAGEASVEGAAETVYSVHVPSGTSGEINITGGSITGGQEGIYLGGTSAAVTVSGGEISGINNGLRMGSGCSADINGGAIEGIAYGVYCSGITDITGGSITGKVSTSDNGTLNITSGTVTLSGVDAGVYYRESGHSRAFLTGLPAPVDMELGETKNIVLAGVYSDVNYSIGAATDAALGAAINNDTDTVTLDPTAAGSFTLVLTAEALNQTFNLNVPVTVTGPVCEIDGTEYITLGEALLAVAGGQTKTIKLLQDIDHDSAIEVDNKNITFDLDGHTLDVVANATTGLRVESGGVAALTGEGATGAFNVTGNNWGVVANNGSATVTNATSAGDAGTDRGAYAQAGGSILVKGDVQGKQGAYAEEGGTIQITGNAKGISYGVCADGSGSSVTVRGDVTATSIGAYADEGGEIIVDGEITAASYIKIGSVGKDIDDFEADTTKEGYRTYSETADNITSTVWVAAPPPPSGTIAGTVKDEGGISIAGATVLVNPSSGSGDILASGTTDDNGAYTISGIPAGSGRRVAVVRFLSGDLYGVSATGVEVVAGGATTVDLVLKPVWATDYPVAGAEQAPGSRQVEFLVKTNTDSTGFYYIAVASPSSIPVALQVSQGKDGTGADALVSGNGILQQDVETHVLAGSLPADGTDYDVYVVLMHRGNLTKVKELVLTTPPAAVCEIVGTGVQYATLGNALDEVGDEDTIRLLEDIDFDGGIVIEDISITFDLNGYTLNVDNPEADGAGLRVTGGDVTLTGVSPGGGFNVTGIRYGAYVSSGSAEGTNARATGNNGCGAYTDSGTIRIAGDAEGKGCGVYALGGSITVTGDVKAPSGTGAVAEAGAKITIDGHITADSYILVGNHPKNEDQYYEPTSKENYRTYWAEWNDSTVWVKIPDAAVEAIDIAAIPGVTAPVKDAAPVTEITETAQYTGTVAWAPADNPFAAETVYTATITLIPKAGFTLTGAAEDFFTVAGATATNDTDSGVVTAVFPQTGAAPGGSSDGGGGGDTPAGTLVTPAGNNNVQGSGVTLSFPAGAVESNIRVQVKDAAQSSGMSLPDNSLFISRIVDIVKDKSGDFLKPVTITISFDKTKADLDKYEIKLCYFDEENGQWVELDNIMLDLDAGTISGETDHFTKFAVIATLKAGGQEQPPLPLPPAPEPEPELPIDIVGHWAQDSIVNLINAGVVSGYPDGSFQPEKTVTRAEFTVMLVKALKLEPKEGPVFTDTAAHWAKESISTAAAHGLITGYGQDTFGPEDLITREQAAVILARAAELAAGEETPDFTDAGLISPWALSGVAAAVNNSFLSGYPDGSFRPQGHTTRAEAAVILAKLL